MSVTAVLPGERAEGKVRSWHRDRLAVVYVRQSTPAQVQDHGESTRLQAYVEHVRYVHPTLTGVHFPDEQIEPEATKIMQAGMDLHVHAWRAEDFRALLARIAADTGFAVSSEVSVGNENIFVLRRGG